MFEGKIINGLSMYKLFDTYLNGIQLTITLCANG